MNGVHLCDVDAAAAVARCSLRPATVGVIFQLQTQPFDIRR